MKIPFSGLVMKQVPPGGDMVDGMFIPEGTRIAHNTFALQRLTSIFGDDAEVFRPERWLEAPEEKVREMTQVVEMAFGYGRWMCAGKSVAFLELNKIFVEVMSKFLSSKSSCPPPPPDPTSQNPLAIGTRHFPMIV